MFIRLQARVLEGRSDVAVAHCITARCEDFVGPITDGLTWHLLSSQIADDSTTPTHDSAQIDNRVAISSAPPIRNLPRRSPSRSPLLPRNPVVSRIAERWVAPDLLDNGALAILGEVVDREVKGHRNPTRHRCAGCLVVPTPQNLPKVSRLDARLPRKLSNAPPSSLEKAGNHVDEALVSSGAPHGSEYEAPAGTDMFNLTRRGFRGRWLL